MKCFAHRLPREPSAPAAGSLRQVRIPSNRDDDNHVELHRAPVRFWEPFHLWSHAKVRIFFAAVHFHLQLTDLRVQLRIPIRLKSFDDQFTVWMNRTSIPITITASLLSASLGWLAVNRNASGPPSLVACRISTRP